MDTLSEQEGLSMLAQLVSDGRIEADQDNALAIVKLCGGLPLALRIAGARLASHPLWSVADLVRRLETDRHRLDELALGDLDVRTSIEVSLAAATEADAAATAAFRLLGLHEGEELDVRVAARLLDLTVPDTEDRLERLVDLHLLESPSPRRYRMHDLIRSFVQDTTSQLTTEEQRSAARLRVLRFYLAMVWRGRVFRGLGPLSANWSDDSWTADAEELQYEELAAWYGEEITEIFGAARRAAEGSPTEHAIVAKLATGFKPYLTRRRLYSDAVELCLLAVAAEETVRDPVAAVLLRFDLSVYYNSLGRYDEAVEAAGLGIAAAVRRGDEEGEVDGRLALGMVAGKQGRWADQDHEFERVMEVMRQEVHPSVRHYNLQQMCISYREGGRLDKALAWSEECHQAAVDFGNVFAIAEALEELGRTQLARGELDAAERHLRAALETVEGNWQPEARVRQYLGEVLSQAGRRNEAGAEWRRSLELLVRHGAPQVDEVRALLAEL